MHVSVPMCRCVYICEYMGWLEKDIKSSYIIVYLTSLKVSLTEPGVHYSAGSQKDSAVLLSPSHLLLSIWDYRSVWPCLAFTRGGWDQGSGLHS